MRQIPGSIALGATNTGLVDVPTAVAPILVPANIRGDLTYSEGGRSRGPGRTGLTYRVR